MKEIIKVENTREKRERKGMKRKEKEFEEGKNLRKKKGRGK